jgi:hypothetical protein
MSDEALTPEEIRARAEGTPFETFAKENYPPLSEVYENILSAIRKYCDLRDDYYNILALWVIGTYCHKFFSTFPFLFFNAMKGSGKTRLMKLLAALCLNGEVLASVSEAVLFRTAQYSTILIDEFEGIGKRDKNTIRELLNAAYKKGITVKRAYKKKSMTRDEIAIEKFDVYCPIAMCNITGMENVLADRCITLTIEKSDSPIITSRIERFETEKFVLSVKHYFSVVCVVSLLKTSIEIDHWNEYIDMFYNYINNTNNTNNTNSTNNTIDIKEINYNLSDKEIEFFNKIKATEIDSRHLELFFPLFYLANLISPFILEETLVTAKKIVEERKGEDVIENRDICLLDFLSKMEATIDFIPITDLTNQFRMFMIGEQEDEETWITSRWIGWALRRLVLLIDKKRTSKGREVMVNFVKAKERMRMFRTKKEIKEQE